MAAKATVAIRRNLCALLLLLYASPPPPKTGESPVPGACNKIAVTKRTETTTCRIENTIGTIIPFKPAFANFQFALQLWLLIFPHHDELENLY